MKKMKNFLLLALAAIAIVGCKDPEPEVVYSLEVSSTSLNFVTEGEAKEFDVTANTDWTISIPADASWVSVSPMSGSADKVVTVMATENDIEEIRSTELTISGTGVEAIKVKVSQAAKDAPLPELSSTIEEAYELEPAESAFSFDITSNVIWAVSAYVTDSEGEQTEIEWITFDRVAGEGNATITATVAANNEPESRSAFISIAGEGVEAIEVEVAQSSANANPDDIIVFADSNIKTALFDKYAYHTPQTIDANGDGEISYAEAAAVTYLNLASRYIKSFDELVYFPALTRLDFSYNEVPELNLQYNTELTYLDYANNNAKDLDLTYNTKITTLKCNNNKLEVLSVAPCTDIQVIDCSYNSLTEFELPKTATSYTVTGNKITTIDVSEYYALGAIYCGDQISTCELTLNEIQANDGTFFPSYNNDVNVTVKPSVFNFSVADEATFESFVVSNDMNGYSGNYAIGIMKSFDLFNVEEKSPVGVAKYITELIKAKGVSLTTVDEKYLFNADLTSYATTTDWELSANTPYLVCAFPVNASGEVDENYTPSFVFDTTTTAPLDDNFSVSMQMVTSTSTKSVIKFTPSNNNVQYHPANLAADSEHVVGKTDAEIIEYLRYYAGADWENSYMYNKVNAGIGAKDKTYTGLTPGTAYIAFAYGLDGTGTPNDELYRYEYTTPAQ